jgi:hypothetical protein
LGTLTNLTNGGKINIEVTFRGEKQEDVEQDMASMLRKCGWICEKGMEWLKPYEVRARYNVSNSTKLSMQLSRYRGQFPAHRSKTGRIIEMQVTGKLGEYLSRLNNGK